MKVSRGVAEGSVLLGRYQVTEQVATGAMSAVYRAKDMTTDRTVAIKMLHAHVLEQEGHRERFEREVRALFGLKHPHILEVLDFGVEGTTPFLVTELLSGRSLDALVRERPLGAEEAIELVMQALDGLAFAHGAGAIHRDLKTENLFVCDTPEGGRTVKLIDFGLVKFVDGDEWGFSQELTAAGDVFGSPAYMSPEQALGLPLDPRSDLYSLGVVLFECLTGRLPFMEDGQARMMNAHVSNTAPRLAEAAPDRAFSPSLEAFFTKALAKQREHRFPSADVMRAGLDRILRELRGEVEPPAVTPATTEVVSRPLFQQRRRVAAALGAGSVAGVLAALMARWLLG